MRRLQQLQNEKDTNQNTASLRFPDGKATSQPAVKPRRLLANDIVALARASLEPSLQQDTPLPVAQGPKKKAWDCTLFPAPTQAPLRDLKRNGQLEPIPQKILACESSHSISTVSLSNPISPMQWAAARSNCATPENLSRKTPGGENLMIHELDQDDVSQYNAKSSISSPRL